MFQIHGVLTPSLLLASLFSSPSGWAVPKKEGNPPHFKAASRGGFNLRIPARLKKPGCTRFSLEIIDRDSAQGVRVPVRISAQAYLEKFYMQLGFNRTEKVPYLEDGIPHIEMLRT